MHNSKRRSFLRQPNTMGGWTSLSSWLVKSAFYPFKRSLPLIHLSRRNLRPGLPRQEAIRVHAIVSASSEWPTTRPMNEISMQTLSLYEVIWAFVPVQAILVALTKNPRRLWMEWKCVFSVTVVSNGGHSVSKEMSSSSDCWSWEMKSPLTVTLCCRSSLMRRWIPLRVIPLTNSYNFLIDAHHVFRMKPYS